MIRIIHILSDSNRSGAPAHVLKLVKGLDRKEFSSLVIGPPGPMLALFEAAGAKVAPISFASKFDCRVPAALARAISSELSDTPSAKVIIHCHGPRAGLFGRLAARNLGYPVVYTEHSWTKDYPLNKTLNGLVQRLGLRYLDRFTSRTIAVSKAVRDFLVEAKISPVAKVTVIYNGIDIPQNILPINNSVLIGSVGSLTWQKNYPWLVEVMSLAVRQLPEIRLEIVGEGPERALIERTIDRLGLQNSVVLVGSLSPEKLALWQARWALYVQPSQSESFGLAAAEAAAAGVPVVASKVEGLAEVLRTENSLFDLSDQEKAAAKIIEFLKNADKRLALQSEQRLHVSRFTVSSMLAGHAALYWDLVA